MDNFIQEELDASCFDGPFSVDKAHKIFSGHFCTAPLGFIEKPGSTALCLICHHSKIDLYGDSMNSWLDPTIDVTKFYTAVDAADSVSIHLLHSLFISPLQPTVLFQTSHVIYGEFFTFEWLLLDNFSVCHGGLGLHYLHVSVLPPGISWTTTEE